MDKFKTFYNEKNGKMILFFGFYLIFFIFLGFYMNSLKNDKIEINNNQASETITTYDMSNLINNDYSYHITITSDGDILNFNGTKNNIDYANFLNKYFLDIYNINQLLKKSKFIKSENNVLSYELDNMEINNVLLTSKADGINKIDVLVDKNGGVEKIVMDLSSYMEKGLYQIAINYVIGEENENSFS